jgi:hypothetical protein
MPTPDQIIDTYLKNEIEYVNTLKFVFANVYSPLHTASGTRSELIPPADLDGIFAQLSPIMEIASDFLATLRRWQSLWRRPTSLILPDFRHDEGRAETFCDFFCRGSPDMFFKLHRGYMCNYPHAVRRLRTVCERSSKFTEFVKAKLQPYVVSPQLYQPLCVPMPCTTGTACRSRSV